MLNDLRFAIRQLWKYPSFTAVAVLTLALGVGANTAIFSIVDAALLRPLPYPEADRVMTLWERNSQLGMEKELVAPPVLDEWARESKSFEALGYWTAFEANLVSNEGVKRVRRAHVSSSVFPILRAAPLMGRGFLPEEDQPEGSQVAVLSYELWQTRFGGRADILGQTLTVDTFGRRVYSIVGVMPPGFNYPERTELWLAAGWNGIPRARHGHWLQVIGRLKPGESAERARVEMATLQNRIAEAKPGMQLGNEVALVPLLEQTLGPRMRPALLMLWGVVLSLLLIACANVANLLLARAVARRKEMGLRAALGASTGRIVRQLLIESGLLALLGGALGALLGWWTMHLFIALSPIDMPRLQDVRFDLRTLAYALAISTVTGIFFGLAPAWNFARPDLKRVLREGSQSASSGRSINRLRNGLVVAEMALSLLLLAGAALMIDTFLKMSREDRGIRADHLLTAQLDFSVSGFTTWVVASNTRPQVKLQQLLERARTLPGAQAVSATYALPRERSGPPRTSIVIAGRTPASASDIMTADYTGVAPEFFNTVGAPLLKGRDFTEQDRLEAPAVIIINESLVQRYFPNQNPIGQRLAMAGRNRPNQPEIADVSKWPEIVGVVADIKTFGLNPESHPQVYVPYWQFPMQTPTLVVRASGDAVQLTSALRLAVREVAPSIPEPTIRTMDSILSDVVAQPRLQTWLSSLFGGLAVTLAAVGLYGTLAFAVAQRRHEIGIRMALGAEKDRILRLVLNEGMRLAGAGAALGLLMILLSNKLLGRFFYNMELAKFSPILGVTTLLFAVALLACWLPARRAARVNPMEALRTE